MNIPAMLKVLQALLDTVKEAGDNGAPAGPMYMAWMQNGGSLEGFQNAMDLLKKAGRVKESNHCYFYVEAKR